MLNLEQSKSKAVLSLPLSLPFFRPFFLDDGAWHKVDITRNRKSGSLQVDAERTSFATPGEAETLELMSPLFIGGLDANIESLFLPPVLWSAGFRQGSEK